MDEAGERAEDGDRGFWQWLRFWIELLILAVLAVLGAFFAARATVPGDYSSGMILILAAIALAFLRLKHRLDGGGQDWIGFVLVDRKRDLAIVLPLLALAAFAGLLVARAWRYGMAHEAGLGLFVVSAVLAFLNIKRVFDRIDSGMGSESG